MKELLFTAITALLTQISLAQTVWVADNNFNAPSGPNVFSTIQAAVNAASSGDIVQVQPSPTTYGNAVIDKQITLMGIGFNVNKDIPLTSNMGNITLTNNASNTTDADGTIIKGLNFTYLNPGSNTGTSYLLENILIQNCQLQYIYAPSSGYSPIDGLEVRDCYITSNVTSSSGLYLSESTTNVIIRNNLFLYGIAFVSTTPGTIIITNNIIYDGIYVNAGSANTKILNNNFIGATATENAFNTELQDCEVSNNIFYGSTPSIAIGGSTSALFQNNTFNNNLIFSTGDNTIPPAGGGVGGNIDGGGNAGGDPDFVNAELLNTWSSTYDFTLLGSPAINKGNDGSDIGITGGSYSWTDTNFVLNTTAVPVIQILNTSTIVNPGVDLPVRIKANSN